MHLLLVGAYRENEVGATHPLRDMLAAIQGAAVVQELRMGPLDGEDVRALMSDTLHQGRDHIEPLAKVVYEKTVGNPFFVIQFLHELAAEGYLAFDPSVGAWTWDLAHIQAKGYTENVFDLLAGKLDRLSVTTQEALRGLACFERGRAHALSIVHECSENELHAMLSEATEAGLVSHGEDGYAFCHDHIREAAYALIPEGEHAAVHLRIGRLLLARLPASDTSENVFDIVNQLNRGAALVTSAEERLRIAELNLTAGRSARATTAYESALVYLSAGESLLSEEHWERNYALRFSLALYRAECEFLTGKLAAADELLSRLRERAMSSTDLAAVTSLRITVNITMNRTDRAIEVGLQQLRASGIEWSAHPSEDEIQAEYDLLRRRIGEHPIETVAELASTGDPEVLAMMQILREMLPAAVFIDKNLHDLAVLRMANLSLERGHCDSSPLAFAQLSMVIDPRFGHRHDGFRFGNLGMALAERGDLARFRGKVYVVVAYHALPWTGPVRAALAVMRRALALTQEVGDMQFSTFSAIHVSALRLATGDPLEDVQGEAERHLSFCRHAGFHMVVYCFLGQLQLMRSLRDQPDLQKNDPASSDEATAEQVFAQDPSFSISACWYWVRKLQARFHAGDYASALEMAAKAERLLWTSPTFFGEITEYHFYSALAHAKAWDSATKAEAPGHHQAIARHQAQLATWAATCVETFGSRAALAAAELARIEDRVLDAEGLYEEAIRSASTAGFANIEALASEMAGQFYRNRGFERLARTYFANACSCYRRWGANGVVRRLGLYSNFDERSAAALNAPMEGLDLATVIKASQTISGEILIDKLVETLMVTAVQNAGAGRGLLTVLRNGEARVEAEATTQLDAVTVRLLGTRAGPSDLPDMVLRYVLRTQEAVILDDATVQNPFSADTYIVENRVRSLLCLPLLKQTALVGVLYLENNVTSHVFTPSRIELLKLLASQAAISLENARLYGDLRESQAYLAEAQRLSQTGSWAWHPGTGEISYWSEECYRLLGFDPLEPLPRFEAFFQRIHRDDQASTREIFESAIRDKADFELDYRYIHADRGIRDIHAVGHAVFDRAGELAEFVGTVIDITERKRAEADLQQLVDFVPQIISVLSSDGTSVHFNRVGREYTGLAPGEHPSADVIGGLIHPDDTEKMRAALEHGHSRNDPFEIEARMLGKDGVYRWFLFRYNPLVEQARVKRWYATGTEIESRKQEEERMRKENVRLEERTRIAQELHDTLLQSIMGASMQFGAAMNRLPADSPVKAKLDPILQLMEQGVEEGRNAIQGLRSSDSRTSDLVKALSEVQQEVVVPPGVDFRVRVAGRQHPLRSAIQQEIYRIGREALVNAFCHSAAKRVECELEYTDSKLTMRIHDNGCGIDPQVLDAGREGHWGITGMRERTTRIGGLLKISSSAAGTEVHFSIPNDVAFQISPTESWKRENDVS
jgi:PAS domain S-box-containing protein